MISFRKIHDVTSSEYKSALDIYTAAFPLNERQPLTTVSERVEKGLSELYVGSIDADVVFMALLWPLAGTSFILLDYMAVHDPHRGKNIAGQFLSVMRQKLKAEKKYFILEVENPQQGDNKEQRRRRLDFYKKAGAKLLKDVRFILPALQGTEPTEMLLMMFPAYEEEQVEVNLVKRLVIQIYKELYNRQVDEDFLHLLFVNAQDKIELS